MTIDPSYEPRMWMCAQCRYVLAVVLRDEGRIRRLYVFTHPYEVPGCAPASETLMSLVRGLFRVPGMDRGNVECQHCGYVQFWDMGEDALEELMEKRKERSIGLNPI